MDETKKNERKIILNDKCKSKALSKADDKKCQSSFDSDKRQPTGRLITSGMEFTVKIY